MTAPGLVRQPAAWDNIRWTITEERMRQMNEKQFPDNACDETSCKDDLISGLLGLFAQLDEEAPASEDDDDRLPPV